MPPRNEWTQRIVDLLADGQWHYETDLCGAACDMVPPGQALRRAMRSSSPETEGWDFMRYSRTIARGQRVTVLDAIGRMVRSGALEQREERGDRQLRLTPGTGPAPHPRDG